MRWLLLFALMIAACSKGPEADLPSIGEARSLAAEWALVNDLANQGKLTPTYVQMMRKSVREQLQTASRSLTQPESAAPTNAPTAGAAASRPTPMAPAPNTVNPSAGNKLVGMPKTIAAKSIAKVDRINGLERAKRRPSRTADRPGRAAPPSGGNGPIAAIAASAAPNDTKSRA